MRVLIVSPHFPPANGADMHRVRLLLPYFAEAGVHVEVLAVTPEHTNCPLDPWLEAGLPPEVPVHRVRGLSRRWSRLPGLGTLGFRVYHALARAGDRLLSTGRFNLVYFSTTVFESFGLGPQWRNRHEVPYVLDYQDPWVNDYYREHPEVRPPGGRLKFALADFLSRQWEPRVLRGCSGITSVSAAYPEQIARRYPWLAVVPCEKQTDSDSSDKCAWGNPAAAERKQLPFAVFPFPGDERDFKRIHLEGGEQHALRRQDGVCHWVYVGVAPPSMKLAIRAFFVALSSKRSSLGNLRLHFIGTSYAPAGEGTKMVEPLAKEYGLDDLVTEHTDRIPYAEALRCLNDADALIVPGSDDPGYTASKIYPYLLVGKPLLAVFHRNSSVIDLMSRVRGGVAIPFDDGEGVEVVAERIAREWFDAGAWRVGSPLERGAFEPYTARAQAEKISGFFRSVTNSQR